jgi:DNA-binding PadR family transcriptional regulator
MTATSYAILGLLAVRSWTTHELVQQVDRSLRRIWPRAQSKLYEEPKKLVTHGFARAADDPVGRRRRTRYTITPKGRRALAAWLRTPGDGPLLEFEQLLKISFADSGSTADVAANLAATRAWVLEQNRENVATARAYLEGTGAFPERAALNQLGGRFLTDFYATPAGWSGRRASWRRGPTTLVKRRSTGNRRRRPSAEPSLPRPFSAATATADAGCGVAQAAVARVARR